MCAGDVCPSVLVQWLQWLQWLQWQQWQQLCSGAVCSQRGLTRSAAEKSEIVTLSSPSNSLTPSHRRDCHFADTLPPSILKHLFITGRGGCSRMAVSPTAIDACRNLDVEQRGGGVFGSAPEELVVPRPLLPVDCLLVLHCPAAEHHIAKLEQVYRVDSVSQTW